MGIRLHKFEGAEKDRKRKVKFTVNMLTVFILLLCELTNVDDEIVTPRPETTTDLEVYLQQ